MQKYSLLYIALVITALVAVLDFIAMSFDLYWSLWWFDNVVHFLAGLAGGCVAVWFLFDSGLFYKKPPTIVQSIIGAFVLLMIVGVAWEIFEYANGLTQSTESYPLDTFHDLLSDAAGSVLAGLIGVKSIFRTQKSTQTISQSQ